VIAAVSDLTTAILLAVCFVGEEILRKRSGVSYQITGEMGQLFSEGTDATVTHVVTVCLDVACYCISDRLCPYLSSVNALYPLG
jgi:hypothetical protein